MLFNILEARTTTQVQQVQSLLRDYIATSLVDLSSQNIDAEIAGLPGDYAYPTGALFLASNADGKPIGCVAIHEFGKPGDAEMKRLFVAPSFRGLGLGRALVETAVQHAEQTGFSRLVLDTMPQMDAAIAVYEGLGFQRIDPYWDNLLPVIYFGKTLSIKESERNRWSLSLWKPMRLLACSRDCVASLWRMSVSRFR